MYKVEQNGNTQVPQGCISVQDLKSYSSQVIIFLNVALYVASSVWLVEQSFGPSSYSHSELLPPQPPMGEEGGRRRRHSSSAGDEGRHRRHPSNTTSKPTQASKCAATAAQNPPKDNAQKTSAAAAATPGKKAEPRAVKKESVAPNKWSPPPVGAGWDGRDAERGCGGSGDGSELSGSLFSPVDRFLVWRTAERGWPNVLLSVHFIFKASKDRQWAWICAPER